MREKQKPVDEQLQGSLMQKIATNPSAFIQSDDATARKEALEREAEVRALKHWESKEGDLKAELDTFLGGLRDRCAGIRPMTPEQEREYNWQNRVKPQLIALGVTDAHCKRIAPQWGCKAQEQAFQTTKARCRMTGAIVALVGNRGLGKTTIAAELMRERIEARLEYFKGDERHGPQPFEPGRYAKLSELGSMFKPLYADFGSKNPESLIERFDAWCRLPLLCLDEIHEAEDLKAQMRLLTDLVDRRYAKRFDTILISNHSASQFKSEINPSILSRISEHGAIIQCEWPSWRTQTELLDAPNGRGQHGR